MESLFKCFKKRLITSINKMHPFLGQSALQHF